MHVVHSCMYVEYTVFEESRDCLQLTSVFSSWNYVRAPLVSVHVVFAESAGNKPPGLTLDTTTCCT